uniref:p53-like n=1 Tax=Glypta fumiferanae TaxID=389681 RepID=A0A0G2JCD5_9HYME|nr:p53-like [Glypta fumiferanae]
MSKGESTKVLEMRDVDDHDDNVKDAENISQRNDVDVPDREADVVEEIVKHYNVNCNDGTKLIRLSEYPTDHKDSASTVTSNIIVEEDDGEPFRIAAIVISDIDVKINADVVELDVLKKFPNYYDAINERLRNSAASAKHPIKARMRYTNDFVIGAIGSANAENDKSMYKITVRRNKNYPEIERGIMPKRFFDRFKWAAIAKVTSGKSKAEKKVSSLAEKDNVARLSSDNVRQKRSIDSRKRYFVLTGADDLTPGGQRSATSHGGTLFEHDYQAYSKKRKSQEESKSRDSRQIHKDENAKIDDSGTGSIILSIGSICALSLGASYYITKRSKSSDSL